MNDEIIISEEEIEATYQKLKKDAEAAGYYLNPDEKFTRNLIRGLLINEKRYGYWACPCRLAEGVKESDFDIICPCDYRDADLNEFNACYCALYVSLKVLKGEAKVSSIPERRGSNRNEHRQEKSSFLSGGLKYPVYRCKVCGYLCARDEPPEICPVCKAKKERFERFL